MSIKIPPITHPAYIGASQKKCALQALPVDLTDCHERNVVLLPAQHVFTLLQLIQSITGRHKHRGACGGSFGNVHPASHHLLTFSSAKHDESLHAPSKQHRPRALDHYSLLGVVMLEYARDVTLVTGTIKVPPQLSHLPYNAMNLNGSSVLGRSLYQDMPIMGSA